MSGKIQRTKFINGETYVVKIALIVGRRDGKLEGNPSLLRIIDDAEVIHLAGGEEFMTVYVREAAFK